MGRDTALGIFEFVADVRSLPAVEFAAKHGNSFLLRTLDDGTLEPVRGFVSATTQIVAQFPPPYQEPRLDSPEASYVYPIRKRIPTAAGPITVGRGRENDIIIDDTSLSKRHAEIHVRNDSTIAVVDCGSTNGTTVGGRRVPPGSTIEVQFGKTVAFAKVSLTYVPASQLFDFIRATFDI